MNVERSGPPGRAVFISYASEDAEAAKRIADALRAFGVEVWFDQNELRGGDSWDANIRKQIKECTLFLPVISVRTEDRHEGYFRREWNLAVERMHDMAKGVSFLLPVVIDDTKETESLVPDEFRTVQWTRLPHGLPGTEFVEHVRGLLEGKRMPRRQTRADGWSPISPLREGFGGHAERAETRTHPENPLAVSTGSRPRAGRGGDRVPPQRNKGLSIWAWAAVALVVAIGLGVVFLDRTSHIANPESRIANPESRIASAALDKSIAVLPFDNRSNLESDQYFTDGIHDDLLTQISRIQDIKTISRTSVMTYRGSNKRVREIGEELGVATVLEGGVQRSGDNVRINVQLIDAATDTHLWADTFDRELTAESIFQIQSEIASAIADALRAILLPEEQQQLEKLPTHNLSALEEYFKGLAKLHDQTEEGHRGAIAHLLEALRLDPEFAPAHATLARTYVSQVFYGGQSIDEQTRKAQPHIDRAIEFDGRSGEAYLALGLMKEELDHVAEADEAFRKAMELSPNSADTLSSYAHFTYWSLGNPSGAVTLYQKSLELEPNNPGTAQAMAEAMIGAGRFEEARETLEATIARHPGFAQAYRVLGNLERDAYYRFDKAIRYYRTGHSLDPGGPNIPGILVWVCELIGDPEHAIFWSERSLRLTSSPDDTAYYQGWIHRMQGDMDQAVASFLKVDPTYIYYSYIMHIATLHDVNNGRYQAALDRQMAVYPAIFDETQPISVFLFEHAVPAGYILKALGREEEASKMADRCLATMKTMPRMGLVGSQWRRALLNNLLGDEDGALDALAEYVDSGGISVYWETLPYFSNLRDQPRFQKSVSIMHDRLAEQRANLSRWEADGELADIPPLPGEAE